MSIHSFNLNETEAGVDLLYFSGDHICCISFILVRYGKLFRWGDKRHKEVHNLVSTENNNVLLCRRLK